LKYHIPVDWKSIVKDHSNTNVTLFLVTKLKWQLSMKEKSNRECFIDFRDSMRRAEGLDYLDAVGGADAKGWKKKAYIIYPNGKADVSSFLFFTNYPKVTLVQIIVPGKTGS
jgi:hypothetical protein